MTRLLFYVIVAVLATGCGKLPDSSSAPGSDVISQGDGLSGLQLDVADYRRYLGAREASELKQLAGQADVQRELVLDYHSDRSLAEYAEKLGLAEGDLVRERLAHARRGILINALMDKATREMNYPDEAQLEERAEEYYLAHKESFRREEGRIVAHILLRDQSGCPCEVASIEDRLTAIQDRLAAGEEFGELAKEYSADTNSAEAGGRLNEAVTHGGKYLKPFERAVFELSEVGEISKPFETPFGTHLVKLLEIQAREPIPFEEVRVAVIKKVKQNLLNSELGKLRSNAYPKLSELQLDSLNQVIEELVATPPSAK